MDGLGMRVVITQDNCVNLVIKNSINCKNNKLKQ